MMVWISLLLAFAAFCAMAASMERHQGQLHTEELPAGRVTAWRLGGSLLLAGSLLPCLARWNTSVAISAWLGLLSLAAAALALLLTYAPQWIRRLALAALTLALAAWLGWPQQPVQPAPPALSQMPMEQTLSTARTLQAPKPAKTLEHIK